MVERNKIARGVVLNWLSLAFSLGVAFLLAPYVVKQLGDAAYGIWVLVNSLVSYMGLLDLGLRGAVTRFVARDYAQESYEGVNRIISAALWIRLWIGFGLVFLSVGLAWGAPLLFSLPPELVSSARWAITVVGINAAIGLTFGVFSAILAALQRFDLLSIVTISQTVVRALGVVWLLRSGSGYSIVALAVWELCVIVSVNIVFVVLSFWQYRELRISFTRPARAVVGCLWQYSLYAFVVNVCVQIVYYTDTLVVGAFLSVGAVTTYAIGGTLVEYVRQLVAAMTVTFTPLASSLDAQGKSDRLRMLLVQGTRAALLIALPIILALFFRGQTFIELWMGPQYARDSGQVLQVLLVAQLFALANLTSSGIAYGLGKHQPVAFAATFEAIANLLLSIFLVQRMGLIGVAWGTVLPSLVTQLFFWPLYVSRLVNLSMWSYLWQAWIRSYAAALPFGLACYLLDRYLVPTNLLIFFLQILALLPIYVAGVSVCFWRDITEVMRSRYKGVGRISAAWVRPSEKA